MGSEQKKKGIFALLGIGILSSSGLLISKDVIQEKKENLPQPNEKKLTGVQCPVNDTLKSEKKENKNEYLFIGCNGFF